MNKNLRPHASDVRRFPRRDTGWSRCHPLMLVISLLLFTAFGPTFASAQEDTKFDAANTSSPRDTLQSFIDACNEVYRLGSGTRYFDRNDPKNMAVIERAVDCIDLSELPAFARDARAAEIAVCLKEIIDRVEFPPWDDIPNSTDIQNGDQELSHYRIPNTRITIAKIEQGDRRHEYLFSTGTAARALNYYDQIQTKPYRTESPPVSEGFYQWFVSSPGNPVLASTVDGLPAILRDGRILGTANWKWLMLTIMLIVSVAAIWLAFRLHLKLTDKAQEKNLFLYWLTLGFPVIAMLIPMAFKFVTYRYLNMRSTPLYEIDFVSIVVALLAALVVVFAVSNRIAATVIASPQINPAGMNAQLIRILSKIASLVASVVLLLYGGQYLGIPLATLLTSAGIGGVAVALGAQDSLKTLFGTLNLLADKPFRVGDRILFKNYDGVVEDISLRSCRIRLLNGNQLTLPNDQLAGSDIENAGRRKYIRRTGLIHIPLDSSAEKVKRAVEILREELEEHEGMTEEHPPRVFFDDITTEAYAIQFYYWYSPPEFWKFKAFGDRLNFAIFQRFESEQIPFSLPSRHSFWKTDQAQGPLDVNLIDDSAAE